jgi:hypothetical protein
MSFAKKYNKASWNFEVPEGLEYTTLKELFENNGKKTEYRIRALYINDGKFGKQPTVICTLGNEVIKTSLPQHLTEVVERMRSDEEDVQAINDGLAGFTIYTYKSDKYGTCHSVNWVDLTQF